MFNNQIFDSWLNKKSDEILSKVDRETISTEEMIILVLKAQTNHFYHTDIDMKNGLADLDNKIEQVDRKVEKRLADLDNKIEQVDKKVEKRLADLDNKIEQVDKKVEKRLADLDNKFEKRFDTLDHKIDNRFMWMIGLSITLSAGLYLKLFLG